jgi:hypothetical protein
MICALALSCSKNKSSGTCYECTAISAGNTYNQAVCTSGNPEDKLPEKDPVGNNFNWTCTER